MKLVILTSNITAFYDAQLRSFSGITTLIIIRIGLFEPTINIKNRLEANALCYIHR